MTVLKEELSPEEQKHLEEFAGDEYTVWEPLNFS